MKDWQTFWRKQDPGWWVVMAIAIIAVWPFLSRAGLPQGTDAELHVFRLQELSTLVRQGEFYPRWAPDFYHAYGYPIFNYYAPLTYYVGLLVDFLPRLGPVAGVKAVFVLGLLMAAIGTYGFVRDQWGRPSGFVAAAMYVYAPYIQYIDPHARGALAESFSFGIFPLALWAVDRLQRQSTRGAWLTAVALTAGTILSHNLTGLLFFGLLTAWVIWQGGWQFAQTRRLNKQPFVALALGLGTVAFFWLVVILERNAINIHTVVGQNDNYDFHKHFLAMRELLAFSQWLDWGATEPVFRFNLGVAQWLLGSVGLGALLWRRTKESVALTAVALAAVGLIFLMTPASTWVWEHVPILPFFQFPWRLMGAAVFMLAVLAGAGTEALARWTGWGWRITATATLLPMLLGLPLSQPAPWPDFGPATSLEMTLIEWQGRWLGTTSTSDYVPTTVDVVPERRGDVVSGLYENHPIDRINWAVVPAEATITTEYVRPLLTRYHIQTPQKFLLRLFLFYFPGWQATIDGQPVEIEIGHPEGFVVIPVPAGEHVVTVTFGSTPARSLAWGITAFSLLLTFIIGFRLPKAAEKEPAPLSADERWVLAAVVGLTAVFLLLLEPLGVLHYVSSGSTVAVAQTAVNLHYDQQIDLLGYDAPSTAHPGQTIQVVLYWKAQRPLEINYQAFVHLLKADGSIATQSDKLNPGEFPTRRWPLDKYVRDVHTLTIPADLPPGDYLLSAGLWNASEGWRLPVLDDSGQTVGDHAVLLTLQVGPEE